MKILHLDGFKSPEEKASYKALIWKNTLESIHTLCNACESLKIPYDHAANKARADAVLRLNVNDSPLDSKADLVALWRDGGIQKAVQRASEFHLLDSAPYFLEAAERILLATYEPNTQDILRSRIATTGIIETEFIIDRLLFRMYDVGGQRGERKKWYARTPGHVRARRRAAAAAAACMWTSVVSRAAAVLTLSSDIPSLVLYSLVPLLLLPSFSFLGSTASRTSPRSCSSRRSPSTTRSARAQTGTCALTRNVRDLLRCFLCAQDHASEEKTIAMLTSSAMCS